MKHKAPQTRNKTAHINQTFSATSESEQEWTVFGSNAPEVTELAREMMEADTKIQMAVEEEKTKRLWLIMAFVAMLAALLILVYAPPGRETLSHWLGGALLIFAAGAAGYKRVWGKAPGFSVGADQDKREF